MSNLIRISALVTLIAALAVALAQAPAAEAGKGAKASQSKSSKGGKKGAKGAKGAKASKTLNVITQNYAQRTTWNPVAVVVGVRTKKPVRYADFYDASGKRMIASPQCGAPVGPCAHWATTLVQSPSARSITFTSKVYNNPTGASQSFKSAVPLNGTKLGVVRR